MEREILVESGCPLRAKASEESRFNSTASWATAEEGGIVRGAAQSERQLIGKNQAGSTQPCALTPLRPPGIGTVTGGSRILQRSGHGVPLRAAVRHRAQAKRRGREACVARSLRRLPDGRDAQITLTAAELRILKEATTTTRRKHGGGDELFVGMHSNLTEDLDPSTADAVVAPTARHH